MSNCSQCGKEFEAKRATAKYCSSPCRLLAFRNVSQNAKDETLSVTDNPDETVTKFPLTKCQRSTRDHPDSVWRIKYPSGEWVIPGHHFHADIYTDCLNPECTNALSKST